jgi:hypothetical protein
MTELLTPSEQLAFVSATWGPKVAATAGKMFRHPNLASVPADLIKELSDGLEEAAGDVRFHPNYLRFQAALNIHYRGALKRLPPRRPKPALNPKPVSHPDAYRGQGTIGKLRLDLGCYSFYETWTLAAENIVQNGLRESVAAELVAGFTVRQLLRRMYGIVSASEPSPGVTDRDESRSFRRMLKRAT